jgi:hypothetical protein
VIAAPPAASAQLAVPYGNEAVSDAVFDETWAPQHIGMFDDSPSLQNVLNQLSSSPSGSFKATCINFGQGI